MINRVTVVDNGSSDGSADGLADLPVPLHIVRNRESVGWGAGCNQGAEDSTADYLLFLNSDTRLFPDTLAIVTNFMDSDRAKGVGICGVQMVDENGQPAISCSRFPTLRVLLGKMSGLNAVFPRLFPSHHLNVDEMQESGPVDQVIGAFYFMPRKLFTKLGGFDQRYFLYFEDIDLALRARREGAGSYFLKEATVFHAENISTSQTRDLQVYHQARSRTLFAYRYWPRQRARLLVFLTFTVELPARLIKAAVNRNRSAFPAIARAYSWFLRDLLRPSPGGS